LRLIHTEKTGAAGQQRRSWPKGLVKLVNLKSSKLKFFVSLLIFLPLIFNACGKFAISSFNGSSTAQSGNSDTGLAGHADPLTPPPQPVQLGGPLNLSLSDRVNRYGIQEITILKPTAAYANAWEDAAIDAQFVSPSGKTSTAGGFYYSADTFKVRFAPKESGTWTFSLAFRDAQQNVSQNGSFQVNAASDNDGFIRLNPAHPLRFITESGKPIPLLGIGDCIRKLRVRV
jgi:hypothetical protein